MSRYRLPSRVIFLPELSVLTFIRSQEKLDDQCASTAFRETSVYLSPIDSVPRLIDPKIYSEFEIRTFRVRKK